MNFINYLLDAADAMLTWDVTCPGFGDAVAAQACFLAGINLDELSDSELDSD